MFNNSTNRANPAKNVSIINGVEDHVILRVPKSLTERVQLVIDGKSTERIQVQHDTDRDYTFSIGCDNFYATLRDLPTIVESHKTKNTEDLYKSADISHVLQVHTDMVGKDTRPTIDPLLEDGLTPAMKYARSERFSKVKPTVLSFDDKEKSSLIKKLDQELCVMVEKLENSKGSTGEKFVYEEIIPMEHYMEYWDDTTVVKQNADNFLSDSRLAYDHAFLNYSEKLKKSSYVRPVSSTVSIKPKSVFKTAKSASRVTKELPTPGSSPPPVPSPTPSSSLASKLFAQKPPSSPAVVKTPNASPIAPSPGPSVLLQSSPLSSMDSMPPSASPLASPLASPSPEANHPVSDSPAFLIGEKIKATKKKIAQARTEIDAARKKLEEEKNILMKGKHKKAVATHQAKLTDLEGSLTKLNDELAAL